MRRFVRFIVCLAVLCPALLLVPLAAQENPLPPRAEKNPKVLSRHGHTRTDDYYWLNQRENPKVIAYLQAENAYTDAVLQHTKPLQEKLYQEMVGRLKQTDQSLPYFVDGYWYYTRFEAGKSYALRCRRKGNMQAREEIMLDGNRMAQGHSYFGLADVKVSPDNRLLAYGVDFVSRRQYRLRFRDLASGRDLADEIPLTGGQVEWAADSRTVLYSVIDDTLRPYKIMRHTLGTPAARDSVVYEEKDSTFNTELKRSRSKQYIFIHCTSTLTKETLLVDSARPAAPPRVFHPRTRGLDYAVDHYAGRFLIRTNHRAVNFRLMTASEGKTGIDEWQEFIPHRDDVLLESFIPFRRFLLLEERSQGLTRLRVLPWEEREGWLVDFADPAYIVRPGINPEPEADTFRFVYSSLTTPPGTYEINTKDRSRKLLKQEEILGGFKAENYECRRITARAHDGVQVPISLVYRKGLDPSRSHPLFLYAYGSYGISSEPGFNSNIISLLDRGMIYAIAHIRGGQEMGRRWYEDGKLLKKINTFTDFICCAEHLVRYGYTSPDKLCISGGSAGGLLMGAVVNLQPDLFKAVVAAVPFVDVVTTMLDESIPLTTGEYDEWGNPNQAEYYDYMLSYSPYDNVRPKHYPAMLVTTGLHDSQVQYWEPAKWVARLRTLKLDKNPLLLYTNMTAGHGGASGRFERLRETARNYAFMLDQLDIRE